MTSLPSHPRRAGRPPRPEIAHPFKGINAMPADGGRVTVLAFWLDMLVLPDKCDRPCWYTWERVLQMTEIWRR